MLGVAQLVPRIVSFLHKSGSPPPQGDLLALYYYFSMASEKRSATKYQESQKQGGHSKPPQQKKEHPLKLFEGKRVTIKDVGPTVIEGDCIVAEASYLLLTNVKIIGTQHIAEAQLLYIAHHRIGFVHTAPTKVEKIEKSE